MTIVSATGVSKAYCLRKRAEPLLALNAVSFSLSEGDLVGYIGPNGAGKAQPLKSYRAFLFPIQVKLRYLAEFLGSIGSIPFVRSALSLVSGRNSGGICPLSNRFNCSNRSIG